VGQCLDILSIDMDGGYRDYRIVKREREAQTPMSVLGIHNIDLWSVDRSRVGNITQNTGMKILGKRGGVTTQT
jgi:hypothetical protein